VAIKNFWMINGYIRINDEIADKKITRCNKIIELKTLGKFLYNVKCDWKNEGAKTVQDLNEMRDVAL
jgi:hypothetical protein